MAAGQNAMQENLTTLVEMLATLFELLNINQEC